MTYEKWIDSNYPDKQSCYNNCQKATIDMMHAFPELKLRVGICNGAYHCWLLNNLDEIVDPTKKQFSEPLIYNEIAARFLDKDEIELSTGAIFLNRPSGL